MFLSPGRNMPTLNSVRIIGGKYRGRRLNFPDLLGLRPTPDRVRETLFNWLMNDIYDSLVLDLFAGSGALGIEALSRGSKHVIFVEKDPKAASFIQENLEKLGVEKDRYKIYVSDALKALETLNTLHAEPRDLIFLDPPFGKNLLAESLPSCLKCLALGGKIYIEQESSLSPENYLAKDFEILKDKTAGEVRYLLASLGRQVISG
jgi:16S rRNA (guanine966-N2)-methyltransferase